MIRATTFSNWSIIDQGCIRLRGERMGLHLRAPRANGTRTGGAVRGRRVSICREAPKHDGAVPTAFGQGQFVAELEERHRLWDQPGKLEAPLLAHPAAISETYRDANRAGRGHRVRPRRPVPSAVFRTKDGCRGSIFEQQLATDFGVFCFRAPAFSQGTR